MNPDRVEKVSEILEGALSVKVTLRMQYLDDACGGDSELRREVESLLVSHEQAGSSFLNPPPSAARPARPAVAAGSRIGAYNILQEIARGGMGEVFAAVRADGQYTKKVAIKLVRGGYDTDFILERFRTERQILAGLDHPNIARLLDGGTTDDGIPYLVMELIEGVPVDQYCARNQLTVAQVLSMFRQICAAVHYAHQRLVIHRDIKPGNILVTVEGTPKLLDFGIAKIFNPAADGEATQVRSMTPEYASPEQLRGKTITTSTDVYSLGVVLYQLLTGVSPYRADSRSPADLARAITEIEPEKPSRAVLHPARSPNENGGAAWEDSRARRSRPLRGDLDAIVLRALRKEPEHRYSSAEQFSEDLARYLSGLPVQARKGSWSYRAGKALRRHKLGVTAAGLIGLAILGGVAATVREARIARRQAAIAEAERARAEKRFNDVREFSDSLLFDIHDAIAGLPGATPARQLLLDRAVHYLDSVASDSAGDPNLQRELAWGYQRLAVVQGNPTESNLGDTAAAEASDRKAAALFEAVAGANPHDAIDQLNVAMIHRILSFSSLLRPSGRQDLQLAMAITDRLMATNSTNPKVRSERSIEYQNLGLMEDALGNRTGALENFRKNLAMKQDLLRTTPAYRRIQEGIGVATVLVAGELMLLGERDEARQQLLRAIEIFPAVLAKGPDVNVERELAVAQVKLGDLEMMDGNTAAARAAFAQARARLMPMAAADPRNQMLQLDAAGLGYEDARLDFLSGDDAAAIAALRAAIRTFEQLRTTERASDDIGPGLATFYIWLGDAQARTRQLEAALDSYRQALALMRPTAGEPESDDRLCQRATAFANIGDLRRRQGRFAEARESYRESLNIVTPLSSPGRGDIPALYVLADAYAGMAQALAAQGRSSAARSSSPPSSSCSWLSRSWETWQKIPHRSPISPLGFLVRSGRSPAPGAAACR